jgi:7-keto-8-aminopelargonate synthetase-like enzyme
MDGDIADIPHFLELRDRHDAVLMVDEAHSLGVLGQRGGGVREHFGLSGRDVDLWMGTLSKALASCGGYIAAGGEMVEYLKYTVPGFMFSVGISPPAAASALAALNRMQEEPDRVQRARARAHQFGERGRAHGLNTGASGGTAIVPVIVGDARRTIALAGALFARRINVQPVLPPAVGEATSRLRFFITADHSEEQIIQAVDAVARELARLA